MYRCREDHAVHEGAPVKLVTETRIKEYPARLKLTGAVEDRGGVGWEIVREEIFCPDHATAYIAIFGPLGKSEFNAPFNT